MPNYYDKQKIMATQFESPLFSLVVKLYCKKCAHKHYKTPTTKEGLSEIYAY